ncbi:MAG: GNA1162 family protein [Smithellaceae bacterium]
MKRYKYQLILPVILGIIFIIGCASKSPNAMKKDSEKSTAKVIAVLPVDNKTLDVKAPQLLRSKVLDELYFKGYSKLPLEVIDRKLEPLYLNEKKSGTGVVSPSVIKELVGADAAMYCTLTEGKRAGSLFYVPVTVAARCELRSTLTGEVLWNAQYKSTSRNFDLPGKSLEMKSYEAFETVLEEVVNKVLETLPDGPNLNG